MTFHVDFKPVNLQHGGMATMKLKNNLHSHN